MAGSPWGAKGGDVRGDVGNKTKASTQDPTAPEPRDFYLELLGYFPWLDQIGLAPQWFQDNLAESSGPAESLARLRATPQYKARFPGLYREDGSVRMNEAQYMAREEDYRTLLRQYGYDVDGKYGTPSSLRGFFESGMDPNELGQRLQTYRSITESSQAMKDAFYVYAGMEVSDDDLYRALVDPAARKTMQDEYGLAAATSANDYPTFIARATEVGMRRAVEKLGGVSSDAARKILAASPQFQQQYMDLIYTGGSPGGQFGTAESRGGGKAPVGGKTKVPAGQPGGPALPAAPAQPPADWLDGKNQGYHGRYGLGGANSGRKTNAAPGGDSGPVGQVMALEDLLAAFEYAMIGAAATEAGLTLPTKERLAEIRAAGVDRNRAIQGYTQFGLNQGVISAAVQRAGYDEFTQDEFERGAFLGNAQASRELQQGLAGEEAAGMGSGEFRFSEDGGRLVQQGFAVRR